MPDTAHWIRFGRYESDGLQEVSEEAVVELLTGASAATERLMLRLVPGRVWRDYQETSKKRTAIREEIRQHYHPPKLIAIADRPATKLQPKQESPSEGAVNAEESNVK